MVLCIVFGCIKRSVKPANLLDGNSTYWLPTLNLGEHSKSRGREVGKSEAERVKERACRSGESG